MRSLWLRGLRGHRRRSDRGAIALLAALMSVALFTVAALAVDLGNVWARRGTLQVQADQAALFGAESLPATATASKAAVARKVAYYIACHPVAGQHDLSPQIPQCGSGTTTSSSAIVTYADQLLASAAVSFPTTTQVRVLTPRPRSTTASPGEPARRGPYSRRPPPPR